MICYVMLCYGLLCYAMEGERCLRGCCLFRISEKNDTSGQLQSDGAGIESLERSHDIVALSQ